MVNKGKVLLISYFTACVVLATGQNCAALPVDLGAAGTQHWTVLETGTGTISQSQLTAGAVGGRRRHHRGHAVTAGSGSERGVVGNVGVGEDGHLSGSGPQFHGDLYLGNNSSAQFSGSYADNSPITGTAHLGSGATVSPNYSIATVADSADAMLDRARADASRASASASALTATSTLSQLNLRKHSLTLSSGVYNLSSLQLTRSNLTLSGSGSFVFNISSVFALRSAHILLAGGATEDNVLFNYTGTRNVRFLGNSVLHGIVLALNARVNLAPGLVVGEIISGKDIAVSSGAMITGLAGTAKRVTVPDATSTFVLVLIALAGLIAFQSIAFRLPTRQIAGRR